MIPRFFRFVNSFFKLIDYFFVFFAYKFQKCGINGIKRSYFENLSSFKPGVISPIGILYANFSNSVPPPRPLLPYFNKSEMQERIRT